MNKALGARDHLRAFRDIFADCESRREPPPPRRAGLSVSRIELRILGLEGRLSEDGGVRAITKASTPCTTG